MLSNHNKNGQNGQTNPFPHTQIIQIIYIHITLMPVINKSYLPPSPFPKKVLLPFQQVVYQVKQGKGHAQCDIKL